MYMQFSKYINDAHIKIILFQNVDSEGSGFIIIFKSTSLSYDINQSRIFIYCAFQT